MADKTDDLIISISTDLATVRRSLKRLETDIAGSSKKIERQFDMLGTRIDTSLTRSFKRAEGAMSRLGNVGNEASMKLAKVFAFAASARGAQSLIDSSTKIQNSLKVAGLEGENLKTVYDALFASAQRNGAPIDALATLYGRAASAAKELGASQNDLTAFTDKVALSLRVSGQSATESAGALLQLGQAIGGVKVQADEYNSLLDGGRPILQAVAAGLTETGGSIGKLTMLVKDGKVSSKAFFDAFMAGSPVLEKAVASAEQTISSRFVRLQNILIDTAGKFDKSSKAGDTFGAAIDSLANEISALDFGVLSVQVREIADAFNSGTTGIKSWSEYLGKISGFANIGDAIAGSNGRSFLGGAITIGSTTSPEEKAIEAAKTRLEIEKQIAEIRANPFDTLGPTKIRQLEGQLSGLPVAPKRAPGLSQPVYSLPGGSPMPAAAPVKPVTLADYAVGDDAADKAANKLKNAYRDLMKSADDRLGQLQQEIELTGQFGIAAETARFKLDLLQDSEDKGRSLSEAQRAELEKKVALYKQYSETLAKAKLSQDLLEDARFAVMSRQDQQVATALKEYGLPSDLNSNEAGAIRNRVRQDDLADGIKSFASEFSGGVLSEGKKLGEAFGDAVQRAISGPEFTFTIDWSHQ